MNKRRILIFITILCLAVCNMNFVCAENNGSGAGSMSLLQNKGVCTHFAYRESGEGVAALKTAGINLVRDEVYWHFVQPNDGDPSKYYFENTVQTSYVNNLIDNGIDVIISLSMRNWNPEISDGVTDTEQERKSYAKFCAETAKHFSRVTKFEIGNEPNLSYFWGATPNAEQYAQMMIEAANAIHNVNPKATVIGGVFSDYKGNEDSYVNPFYDYPGVYDAIDAVSIHPYYYYDKTTEMNFEGRLRYHYEKIDELGGIKDLYITEVGWPTVINSSGYGEKDGNKVTDISQDKQAQEIIKAYTLSDYYNIENITTYDLRNDGDDSTEYEHNFGLIMKDGTPKKSYNAVTEYNTRIGGAPYMGALVEKAMSQSAISDKNIHIYNVDGTPVGIAWCYSKYGLSQTYTFENSVSVYDIYGNLKTTGKKITLTNEPVYIYGISENEMYNAAINEVVRNINLVMDELSELSDDEASALYNRINNLKTSVNTFNADKDRAKANFDELIDIGDSLIEAYRNSLISIDEIQLGVIINRLILSSKYLANIYASTFEKDSEYLIYSDPTVITDYTRENISEYTSEAAMQARAILKVAEKFANKTNKISKLQQMTMRNGFYCAYYELSTKLAKWANHVVEQDVYAVAQFDGRGNLNISGAVGSVHTPITVYVLKPSANGEITFDGIDYIDQINSDANETFDIKYKSSGEFGDYTIMLLSKSWLEPMSIMATNYGQLQIMSKHYENQAGNEISQVKGAVSAKAVYGVKNLGTSKLDVSVIIAGYDEENGALVDVKVSEESIEPGAEYTINTEWIEISGKSVKLKTFIWENIKTLTPLYGGYAEIPFETN